MRKARRHIWLAVIALVVMTATGCNREAFFMFEDGEFDGMEYSNEILMLNSELENDDVDR